MTRAQRNAAGEIVRQVSLLPLEEYQRKLNYMQSQVLESAGIQSFPYSEDPTVAAVKQIRSAQ